MNPLRALLWKEGRTAAPKVAAVAGLALLVGLAHTDSDFSPQAGAQLVGVLAALLMSMDLVAGERSRGTLPFLSNLPVRTAWVLGGKYAVGAAGLLVVLAAYWAGVYLGMSYWGDWSRGHPLRHPLAREVFTEVGYGRILLLWFLFYLIPYSAAFLSSTLSNRPLQAAGTGLLTAFVGGFLLNRAAELSDPVSLYFGQILENGFYDGLILRPAFDPALLLARAATALLLAGCVVGWSCRAFRGQGSRRFHWIMGALALICLIVTYGSRWVPPEPEPAEPAGRLPHLVGLVPYRAGIVELVVRDRMAMVLLTSGLSIVDVSDSQAPREVGRVEMEGWWLHRLAVSASAAYVWGWMGKQDSVGVAVFDLSRPERPRLRAQHPIYPVEPGPTPWLRQTPRLTTWTVREGYLYAGLLGREFLELHSFDVREGGLPRPVQVLRIEETARHVWNDDWEMHLEGENAFLTLGHDFVVLDLTDPAAMGELGRTSLRRFGRSARQYEEQMEALHLQLAQLQRAQLPVETAFVVRSRGGPEVHLENEGARSQRTQWIYVPQALGTVSLNGDKAYVLRHWPRELAVIDIGDPQRPMEVDYVRLPRWIAETSSGRAYQLIQEETVSMSVTISGRDDAGRGSVPRTWLQLGGQRGQGEPVTLSFPKAEVFPVDDHLCTILHNNLAIFEMPPPEP